MDLEVLRPVHVEPDVGIEPADRALDRFEARPHVRAAVRMSAPADRAGTGEVMIDLPPHRSRLANHRRREIGGIGRRCVHDHRQRRLQRMGKVAGVAARLLGLTFVMFDQAIQLLDHRRDLDRHRPIDPRGAARAHLRDFQSHLAERPKPIEGLERGHHDQTETEQKETADQRASHHADLVVEPVAAGRHLKTPANVRSGQLYVAFEDAQLFAGELVAVEGIGLVVNGAVSEGELTIPQRSRRKILMAGAADLPVKPGIGFEKALVRGLAVEHHFAVGPDFRGENLRAQHIAQLVVEILGDGRGEASIQRITAARQQDGDPGRGDQDHPLAQRSGHSRSIGG